MKTTKLILAAALIGTASLSAAHAGVRFGISFSLPVAAPAVVVAPVVPVVPAPVVVVPAIPVSTPAPIMVPAAPVVVAVPACPGPDYVWTAGYWNTIGYNRVWVPGAWTYHPRPVVYVHGRDYGHGWRH